MTNPPRSLTPERIHQVLTWLQAGRPTGDSTINADYERLMEIYCVVKTGGIEVQQQASQEFMQREQARIEAEIAAATANTAPLQQEIMDLKDSTSWRLNFLNSISPEEEAIVGTIISALESQHNRRYQ